MSNLTRSYDNRDRDAVIAMLEDRVASMARRIVELMGENQILRDALELARQRYDDKGGESVH